jgi:2-polyprenyl-3-methyl-5-hydroxy-6-metoxy-1,4-benzoquinol methylase
MNEELQQQLLALNSAFYSTVAEPFDTTRLAPSVGKSELVRRLPLEELTRPSLADIGCGNGRLAWLLEERGVPLAYVGVDANAHLLAMAQAHTASLCHVRASFVQADLAQPDWPTLLPGAAQIEQDARDHKEGFDIVTCLATLHHLPGYDLRLRVVRQLAALVKPAGIVAISTWQFLTSARFIAKQVDWAEVGIDGAEVEPGDALLPWKQGGYAVRYLHQIDMDEVMALSDAAGLRVEATYFADGKEGNLNLYAILRRQPAT